MKKTFIKGTLIFSVLLISVALAGQVFYNRGNQASVAVVSEKVLVPGGQSVGVKMDVRGVLIVGLEEIDTSTGEAVNPGLLSGLQIGDMIISINGTDVYGAEEVQELVNEIKGSVSMKVKRENKVFNVKIEPVLSSDEKVYKLGIWVKDKTAGIGTLTYYDPANSTFGALGHGIVDPESGSVLSVDTGTLLEAKVQEVYEGEEGQPGEIRGVFYHTDSPIGNLKKNCDFGLFGTAYYPVENSLYDKPLAVATQDQVELGPAYILTTLSDNEIKRYEVEIEKIDKQREPEDKGMVIKVTDERLLAESGGIVQGMSGSPIIQNDRIIGAVTHVFLNDPERGYGIFIEWMLDMSNFVEK